MGSVNFHANPDSGLVNGNPENQWVLIEIEGERAGQNPPPPSALCNATKTVRIFRGRELSRPRLEREAEQQVDDGAVSPRRPTDTFISA